MLDNDGVICLSNNWGGRTKKWAKYRSENPDSSNEKKDAPVEYRFDDFDTKAIKVLNEIIEEIQDILMKYDIDDKKKMNLIKRLSKIELYLNSNIVDKVQLFGLAGIFVLNKYNK